MNTLAALAQSSETTEWTPLVVVILMGAMALLLGLVRLLRRVLGLMTRVLVSAGAAMTGIATMLAACTVLTTLLLVYVR
ncbi:hypothetical protein FHS29_004099 [Saccharothrix tamanrassetensis]|uniref:Uncharacterized protein n=1 Tax=Saccharothrix tamanrassetensis TaxID=1051531 RepID=A0A841CMB5_9PSEU|nr:hypothetical protein [Saccharothrix tamanrassetensis]MBB5957504.1 hypothetical protein [Saccharothrix tamanrassetensis]